MTGTEVRKRNVVFGAERHPIVAKALQLIGILIFSRFPETERRKFERKDIVEVRECQFRFFGDAFFFYQPAGLGIKPRKFRKNYPGRQGIIPQAIGVKNSQPISRG